MGHCYCPSTAITGLHPAVILQAAVAGPQAVISFFPCFLSFFFFNSFFLPYKPLFMQITRSVWPQRGSTAIADGKP